MSSTVTVAVQVEVFPLASVTVKVTTFAPTFAQLKLEGDTLNEAMESLSVLPPSIWEAVIEAEPVPSSCTVIFWQIATGSEYC